MKEILSNPTMTTILIVTCTALVIGIQYLFGYKKWKPLGILLPILLIGFVVYCFLQGRLTLSVRDILMPLLGLLALASSFQRGYDKAKSNQAKELERMKAQDNLK